MVGPIWGSGGGVVMVGSGQQPRLQKSYVFQLLNLRDCRDCISRVPGHVPAVMQYTELFQVNVLSRM